MSIADQLKGIVVDGDAEHREEFLADVEGWCRVHGLVMGSGAVAPLSLVPHPLKKEIFEEGLALAPLFGTLVQNISLDPQFLIEAHHNVTDDFTTRLISILKHVLKEGIRQPTAMGIHRSDYMIHHGQQVQQVELNTISSAFGALASRIAALHHYILHNWISIPEGMSLPQPNPTLQRLPNGFAVAVNEYRRFRGSSDSPVVVMMIVQPGERNSIDQRWLQHTVFENHGIRMIRRSLGDVASRASLDQDHVLKIDGHEVAVAYFRAGYTPTDYPSEHEWSARLLIERSVAIKCPNIAYHLAGTKKIQQTLYDRAILKKYLPVPAEEARVFKCFTDQYSLDPGLNADVVEQAIKDSHAFVMKPQREGGGNLIANADMAHALQTMPAEERSNYILMRRIVPAPKPTASLRESKVTWMPNSITEFGVFTVFVGRDQEYLLNEAGGWLLRTKDETLEDGGVAAGRAYLDSPVLLN